MSFEKPAFMAVNLHGYIFLAYRFISEHQNLHISNLLSQDTFSCQPQQNTFNSFSKRDERE